VPIAFHFGGISSVVPSDVLSRIDFFPGNFGPEYSRAMGGVIDIGVRSPSKDRLHGIAQVDILDARAPRGGAARKVDAFSGRLDVDRTSTRGSAPSWSRPARPA
jgi:hypothetical protein